ncbi:HAMP domain-containing protein [Marinobacter mobilis]|uniref:HAMP domain-containing protein n=2 Tax=Marinobacter mobilis TaxID=488533 RepID=A0A1H2ZU48_9GAMM|nr:methyl-accepting chemotaxis protein [Marinobacter mobilis]SDX21122.1 HAMP domain-containing protein [Marinobacter mobilis]
MNWYNRSILNRVLTIIVAVNLVFAVIAAFYIANSMQSRDRYDHLTGVEMVAALETQDLLISFKTQVQEWKNVLIRGADAEQLDKYWSRFQQRETDIQSGLDALIPRIGNEQAADLLRKFQRAHQTMGSAYRQGYQTFVDAGMDTNAGDRAVAGIDREPAKLIDEAVQAIRSEALAHSESLSEQVAASSFRMGSILLVAIIAGTVACLLVLMRAIIRPTQTIIGQLQNLGNGDLSDPVTLVREDELGQLADAARRLHEFLAGTSTQMTATAHQLKETRDIISVNANQVSAESEQAHLRIDQIATAMNEMSATAQDVASHAVSVASQVQETSDQTRDADGQINNAMDSMNRLAEQIRTSSETVNQPARA